MKQIHRKNFSQNADASLFLFDILPLENFKKEFMKQLFKKESLIYKKFIKTFL